MSNTNRFKVIHIRTNLEDVRPGCMPGCSSVVVTISFVVDHKICIAFECTDCIGPLSDTLLINGFTYIYPKGTKY